MLIQRPTLKDIVQMRELVSQEVQRGIILERSEEEMATSIRSYHIVRRSALDSETLNSENSNFENLDFENAPSQTSNYHALDSENLNSQNLDSQISESDPIIGFCALYIYSKDLGELRSLVVAPQYRRKGVASALINSVKDEARALGLKDLLTLTYRAPLFQKCGFVIIDKALLPNHKIWADCIKCKHFPICDEIALLVKL